MEYMCNDCDDEPPFTGICKYIPPRITAKPKGCPIFLEPCNWIEI